MEVEEEGTRNLPSSEHQIISAPDLIRWNHSLRSIYLGRLHLIFAETIVKSGAKPGHSKDTCAIATEGKRIGYE